MSIKTILISQPKPANENSPYSSLTRKHKVKIDFRKFIHVEGLTAKEVRAQRVDFSKFHNVILTSRNSVDHFFRIAEEMRYPIPNALTATIPSVTFLLGMFFFLLFGCYI